MSGLTTWDYFVLLVMFLSIVFGLARGLVRTVFALAAWVAAVLLTPLLGMLAIQAVGMQNHPWVVYVLAFLALFIGVRWIGGLLSRGLRAVGLGAVDRGLGGVLGVARALLIIAVAVVVARYTGLNERAEWRSAWSRPLLEEIGQWVQPLLPEGPMQPGPSRVRQV